MSSSSSTGAGAINLLEKYTTLNKSMDDARRENAHIQSEKESIRLQVETLQTARVELQAQTEQARDETTTLSTRVNEAHDEYNKLEQRHAQALLKKTEASRQLQFTKSYMDSSRLDFLQQSRDFLTTCKRMRLSASSVGEESATCMAFLERHDVTVDWMTNEVQDTNMENGDLEQAIQAHALSKRERDKAQRTLEAVRARQEASSQKSSSRQSQKNKLLAQLERVRKETMDCENQLKDLDQQTMEAREMAHNYEKDVNRRMSRNSNRGRGLPPSYHHYGAAPPSVTPNTMPSGHGPPQNPYAAARNPPPRRGNSRAPSAAPTQSFTRNSSNAWDTNEAQPHLTNRRRLGFTNRQFGSTALDIISGRETDQHDEDEDDYGVGASLSSEAPPSTTYQQTTTSSSRAGAAAVSRSVNLDISDSDEDDDDLFSGPVFSKK